MGTRKSLRDVLLGIRRSLDRSPPSEWGIQQEAFFTWQGRGGGDGNDQNDWFNARRRLETDEEFRLVNEAMSEAVDAFDFELRLGLSVVRNIAIMFDMRPTDVKLTQSLQEVEERKLMLIVAGVGHNLHFRFGGKYRWARDVASLANQLYGNEYRRHKGC